MRLLANENVAQSVIRRLRESGHDVLSVKESMTGAEDRTVLARAVAEERVVLTLDKDFGELAFRSKLSARCGVILVRITPRGRERDALRITEILLGRNDWTGAFWVITDVRIRRRPL
jgi:predicted nuclease of predicted toxin-antitoxin system